MTMDRRRFLSRAAAAAAAAALVPDGAFARLRARSGGDPLFRVSLAEWSLHRTIRAGELDPLDFAPLARERYELGAVEHVNQFFMDRAGDARWLAELKRRADDAGVRSLIVMCDGEGMLGAADGGERKRAVRNHFKWIEAAAALDCHSVRVNADGEGSRSDQMKRCADGLRELCEYADRYELNVIVENHGGLSSDGEWLAATIRRVDHPRAGTLADPGNFVVSREPLVEYPRYRGMEELMPFARGVSAKTYDFGETGDETTIDYRRILGIVLGAGYHGHLGVEYEGDRLSEDQGIRATLMLLDRLRAELEPAG